MNEETKTRRFLKRVLRDHYSTIDIKLPFRFTRREFAFIYMRGKGMHRPVAFSSRNKFIKFVKEKIPLHVYYSTAYYSNPQDPMKNKDWLGADLVFDLDADHLPEGEKVNYPEQLRLVKKKTLLLIEDFLMEDFGFEEKELSINFSGHRGYHIHVRNKDILNMNSHARREIVDYITGVGLDVNVILPTETFEVDQFMDFKKKAASPKLPPEEEGGWRKRTRIITNKLLERWNKMEKKDVITEMTEKHGVGEKTAKGLYDHLFIKGKWKKVVEDGILDIFPEKGKINVKSFEEIIRGIIKEENIQEIGSEIIGTTDEPVTGDIKRLIRLPTSIHGGSFLEVRPLSLKGLKEFEPLNDAIPSCLGNKNIDLKFQDIPDIEEIEIGGEYFNLNEKISVPEYAAPFLISKFNAKII